jgi:hypothetical protein
MDIYSLLKDTATRVKVDVGANEVQVYFYFPAVDGVVTVNVTPDSQTGNFSSLSSQVGFVSLLTGSIASSVNASGLYKINCASPTTLIFTSTNTQTVQVQIMPKFY